MDKFPDIAPISKAKADAEKINAAFIQVGVVLRPVVAKIAQDLKAIFGDPELRALLQSAEKPRHPRDPRRRGEPLERGTRGRRRKWSRDYVNMG